MVGLPFLNDSTYVPSYCISMIIFLPFPQISERHFYMSNCINQTAGILHNVYGQKLQTSLTAVLKSITSKSCPLAHPCSFLTPFICLVQYILSYSYIYITLIHLSKFQSHVARDMKKNIYADSMWLQH